MDAVPAGVPFFVTRVRHATLTTARPSRPTTLTPVAILPCPTPAPSSELLATVSALAEQGAEATPRFRSKVGTTAEVGLIEVAPSRRNTVLVRPPAPVAGAAVLTAAARAAKRPAAAVDVPVETSGR